MAKKSLRNELSRHWKALLKANLERDEHAASVLEKEMIRLSIELKKA